MSKRKLIDWDSIEPLYRSGSMSNCDICRQYEADHTHSQTWKKTVTETAIRKRAKEKGWQKDIAEKVKNKVREDLVRGEVRGSNLSDEEVIEQASKEPVQIGLGQRARTAKLLEIQDELAKELRANKTLDIMTRVRGFKDIAAAVKMHHDQQAEQYHLKENNGQGKNHEDWLEVML